MRVLSLLLLALVMPSDPISEWDRFEKSVRDQIIHQEEARKQLPVLIKALKEKCHQYAFKHLTSWQFPVQGYGVKDVGAGGFKPKGYNFYDGNHHGGHPAYDIFIRDRNQDSLDDKTSTPVVVLAPVDLLILSIETNWTKDSEIRGGRYVWALDPITDRVFYFAHLSEIRKKPGAFCPAGSIIGTVGRTGKNAQPPRSPTHLHLMVLEIKNDALLPLDYSNSFDGGGSR
jgi:hypothetical protein